VQARLIAAAHGLGRASKFVEGYPIDADFLQFIPHDLIGKETGFSDFSCLATTTKRESSR
jgi:hypothetical protein